MAPAARRPPATSHRKTKRGSVMSIQLAEEVVSEVAHRALRDAYESLGGLNAHRHAVATMAAAQLQAVVLIHAAHELAAAIREAALVDSTEERDGQQ